MSELVFHTMTHGEKFVFSSFKDRIKSHIQLIFRKNEVLLGYPEINAVRIVALYETPSNYLCSPGS